MRQGYAARFGHRGWGYAVAFAVWVVGGLVVFTMAYGVKVDRDDAAAEFPRARAGEAMRFSVEGGRQTLWIEAPAEKKSPETTPATSPVTLESLRVADAAGQPIAVEDSGEGNYNIDSERGLIEGEALADIVLPAPTEVSVAFAAPLASEQAVAAGSAPLPDSRWYILGIGLVFAIAAIVIARSTGRHRARLRAQAQQAAVIDQEWG